MSVPLRVLIAEDSEDDALLIVRELRRGGYDPTFERVDTPEAFTAALAGQTWDVVVADYAMPCFSGLAALRLLQESGFDLPFIIVSGTIGEDVAVEAMRAGAHDYVMKDNLTRLAPAVRRELREAETRRARRWAEGALRESEEKFRSVVENSHNGVLIVDDAYRFIYVNDELCRILGYPREEIVGRDFRAFLDDESKNLVVDRYVHRQRGHEVPSRYEFHIVRKSGERRRVEISSAVIKDSAGDVRTVAHLQDITERRQAEEALRRRNRQLTALYEIGRDISATLDLPTVLERIATHARDLLGADDSEVYLLQPGEETLRAIVALGDYADEVKAATLRLGEGIVGCVAQSGEAEIVNHVEQDPRSVQIPGTPVEAHALMCAPLISKGQVTGVMALARLSEYGLFDQDDLDFLIALARQVAVAIENARLFATEQQRAAELARALEQQQELERLKDEFVQNASHELRTPLALIRGYAELLDGGELGELQPIQRESVSIIARRVYMLSKLVDDFTAVLETERRESQRELVNLAGMVRDVLADFEVAMEQAGVTLAAQIAPGLPPILGDQVHLRRVLDNLLGNALKFTPSGGRVVVCLVQDGDNLVLDVEDNGVGIPADQLERVFERFYQVDGSMSRRYGGAGLGLALVKAIVEAHGGKVGVESEVGRGSTFTVTLPVQTQLPTQARGGRAVRR